MLGLDMGRTIFESFAYCTNVGGFPDASYWVVSGQEAAALWLVALPGSGRQRRSASGGQPPDPRGTLGKRKTGAGGQALGAVFWRVLVFGEGFSSGLISS